MDAAQGRRMPHEWRILEQGPEGLTDIDLLSSLLARSSRRFAPEEIAARVLSTGLSALRRGSADGRRGAARDEAGRALGIEVVDHLVLADGTFRRARQGPGLLPRAAAAA